MTSDSCTSTGGSSRPTRGEDLCFASALSHGLAPQTSAPRAREAAPWGLWWHCPAGSSLEQSAPGAVARMGAYSGSGGIFMHTQAQLQMTVRDNRNPPGMQARPLVSKASMVSFDCTALPRETGVRGGREEKRERDEEEKERDRERKREGLFQALYRNKSWLAEAQRRAAAGTRRTVRAMSDLFIFLQLCVIDLSDLGQFGSVI